MTNTPPYDHHFMKATNSPGHAILFNGTPLFINGTGGSPMQGMVGDGNGNVLNLLHNGLAIS